MSEHMMALHGYKSAEQVRREAEKLGVVYPSTYAPASADKAKGENRPHGPFTKREKIRIMRLHQAGIHPADIAILLKRSEKGVRKYLAKNHKTPNRRTK